MNCNRDLVLLYAGRELKKPAHRRVSRHLTTCDSCRRYLEMVGDLHRQIASLPDPSPSTDLVIKAIARLPQNRKTGFNLRLTLKMAAVTMSAAFVFLGILMWTPVMQVFNQGMEMNKHMITDRMLTVRTENLSSRIRATKIRWLSDESKWLNDIATDKIEKRFQQMEGTITDLKRMLEPEAPTSSKGRQSRHWKIILPDPFVTHPV